VGWGRDSLVAAEGTRERERNVWGRDSQVAADSAMAKGWATCADSEGFKAQRRRGGGAEKMVAAESAAEGEMESLQDLFGVSGYSTSLRWCVGWMCGVCVGGDGVSAGCVWVSGFQGCRAAISGHSCMCVCLCVEQSFPATQAARTRRAGHGAPRGLRRVQVRGQDDAGDALKRVGG
jgi:hypothetical protein